MDGRNVFLSSSIMVFTSFEYDFDLSAAAISAGTTAPAGPTKSVHFADKIRN